MIIAANRASVKVVVGRKGFVMYYGVALSCVALVVQSCRLSRELGVCADLVQWLEMGGGWMTLLAKAGLVRTGINDKQRSNFFRNASLPCRVPPLLQVWQVALGFC